MTEQKRRLSEIEDRIKIEMEAYLWRMEPLLKERAKLRAALGETK